jgi:universal stress protein E
MFHPKSIMVVVDYRQENHHALPRAAEFARYFSAKLTLVCCVYPAIMDYKSILGDSLELIKQHEIKEKKDLLDRLIEEFELEDLEIEVSVIWHKNFYKGLLNHIHEESYDLVVKTAHSHHKLSKLIMKPMDWHLLREVSEPILLVKEAVENGKKNIMGAIKIQSNGDHHALNHKILDATIQLSEMGIHDRHLVNVFPWPMVDVNKFKHLFNESVYFDAAQKAHKKSMDEYLGKYDFEEDNIHVIEGLEPEEIIPDMVTGANVDLLVMGSVGRDGFAAAMIGNTAEKILDELDCDVLVLKPDK